jgi:hypothetical protein
MRLKVASIFVGILLVILGTGAWYYSEYRKPRQAFERLIHGGQQVSIKSLSITGQGQTVFIDDPLIVQYLSQAFRLSLRGYPKGGLTYHLSGRLSTGGTVGCGLYLSDETEEIAISFPDEYYHRIRLPQPVPEELSMILLQLKRKDVPMHVKYLCRRS